MAALVVIDYGAGNIASVVAALERLGAEAVVSSHPDDVASAGRIVLPGVGAAGLALDGLRARGLEAALADAVLARGRPFLGICIGMQVMATRLTEFGVHRGLGWIEGEVVRLDEIAAPARIPHMGWAEVQATAVGAPLMEGVRGDRQFYFCHSYGLRTSDTAAVAATVDAGGSVVAAVRKGSAWGVQFHPEKSQISGARLLEAFLMWSP